MKNYVQFIRALRKATLFFALSLFGLMLLDIPVLAQEDSSEESITSPKEKDKDTEDEFTLEEIVVTGSIIRNTGMEAPTPVTVVTLDEVNTLGPVNVIEGLAELPQFYGSATTQDPGEINFNGQFGAARTSWFESGGAGTLNMRGLQSRRSLQLLDGRRVVQSSLFGGPDINLFPKNLLRSVESVTGGATATYGTDAVAGVVNYILNTQYEGIRANVQWGMTEKGHNKNDQLSFTAGFQLTDSTRIVYSAEKSRQDPIRGNDILDYDWYDAWALLPNTAAGAGSSQDNPLLIPYPRVYSMNDSLDGIINFGGSIGRYIFNADGYATPFVMGAPCNPNQGCSTVNGGSGTDNSLPYFEITPESSRENFFGYIEHMLKHNLKVYGQAMYGKSNVTTKGGGGAFPDPPGTMFDRGFHIYSGNPYLPADMQAIFDNNVLATDPDNGAEYAMFGRRGALEDLGANTWFLDETKTLSLTAGMEYNITSGFLNDWQVRSYFQYGETDAKRMQRGGLRLDRIYLAMDVVPDPLNNNEPICNVVLTNRDAAPGTPGYDVYQMYQDCVPLNLFGRGNASPEAIAWVTGFEPGVAMHANGYISDTETLPHDYISSEDKTRILNIDQYVFDITADGPISDGWGAGPIKAGVGYGYRKESFTQVVEVGPGGNVNVDPTGRPVLANSTATVNTGLGIRGVPGGNMASGNLVEIQFSAVPFARGEQDVHEAFGQLWVPLITDKPFFKKLTLDTKARWAKYSGSGNVGSWKGGLGWVIFNDLKLRGSYSKDVRAANMAEKYDRTGGVGNVTDWQMDPTGQTSYAVTRRSNGSPDIEPEDGTTLTIGAVYQPGWLEGLTFSADYLHIEIKDNITKKTSAEVVEGCYEGDQELCALITRGGDLDPVSGLNFITLVGEPYINQDLVKMAGVDVEMNYNTSIDLFGGGETAGLRLVGAYMAERVNTNKGVITHLEGTLYAPKYNATLTGRYTRGGLGVAMVAKYTSPQKINRFWNNTTWNVSDNTYEAEIICNANVSYRWKLDKGNMSLYANISDLFDKGPQQSPGAFSTLFGGGTGLGVLGDERGRRFVVGLTYEFKE